MALLPTKGRDKLEMFMNDFRYQPPDFHTTTSPIGLSTTHVYTNIPDRQGQIVQKMFVGITANSPEISEDSAARIALQALAAHFEHDETISAYMKQHIFPTTKRAWEKAANEWRAQYHLEVARNRQLTIEKFQQIWMFSSNMQEINRVTSQQHEVLRQKVQELKEENTRIMNVKALMQQRIETLEKNQQDMLALLSQPVNPNNVPEQQDLLSILSQQIPENALEQTDPQTSLSFPNMNDQLMLGTDLLNTINHGP